MQDFQAASKFIEALTGSPDTPCTWQTFSDIAKQLTAEEAKAKAKTEYGTLREWWPQFLKWQDDKRGIYVTIQETGSKARTAKDVTSLRALMVDIDPPKDENGNPRPFTEQERAEIIARFHAAPIPPHMIVFSGNGVYGYWWLEPGQAIDAFGDTQKHLIQWFKSDAAVHDLPRVMRLPGTLNLKSEPRPAFIIESHDAPRVTLEQIRAAYPMPEKPPEPPRKAFLPDAYQLSDDDMDYQTLFKMTQKLVRRGAERAAIGNRHNSFNSLACRIAGRLNHSDGMLLAQEFAQITGQPEPEVLKQLDWGYSQSPLPQLPKRNKPPTRLNTYRKKQKAPGASISDERKRLKAHLADILKTPDGRFHLISGTVGLGKTAAIAEILNEMHREGWPLDENGQEKQIAFLSSTKALIKEFQALLNFDDLIVDLGDDPFKISTIKAQQGRNSDNCKNYHTIETSDKPNSFCKDHCEYRSKCAYFAQLGSVSKQKLILAVKQSYLHNKADLGRFHVVIADEDITNEIIQEKSFSIEDLHQVKTCLLYTSPSPRDRTRSRMPSSA